MNVDVRTHILESIRVKRHILDSPDMIGAIQQLGQMAGSVLNSGGRILLAGNGGSFADAQHIAAEFVSKLKIDRQPLPAIALGTNSSSLSAIGNDYGFEYVFDREIQALATSDDLFIPITTSGNSPNIIKSVKTALDKNLRVFGLTGLSGGKLAQLCSCIKVPSAETALIQESHIMIGHIVCSIAEQGFLPTAD